MVLLPVFLILTACPHDHGYSFRFSNNSNVDVYVYLGIGDRESDGYLITDTTITFIKTGALFKKDESYFYRYHDKGIPVNTWCLFIFDADTFNIYSWEEIKNGYKILQRYDINDEDLKALKYNITYPPTEAMKNMKMYPPYEQ